MRVSYILAVLIVAILHSSGIATKDAKTVIENMATSPALADVAQGSGGRLLRRVDTNTANKNELEEERFFRPFGKWLQKQSTNWKEWRKTRKATKKKARADRMAENIRFAGGRPGFGA
ncbi:Secreted RxLR effector peptide protein [Phytophthora palmivora]|uniref:RxLR effector protein n=1 Tax=Phytophthora palmivora TaxID=4796 RepID=A0A2P4XA60_9STRA|nr:Secreted RxLR effector peptide protein [Phytophthora palmivora]